MNLACILRWSLFLLLVTPLGPIELFADAEKPKTDAAAAKSPTLVRASMCEGIQEFLPHNPAVVFSVSTQNVYCYTHFDPVHTKGFVYHKWYQRDRPSATLRLTLQPPRWSTYSHIRLRAGDKGPWRVDIVGENNQIYQTLRFSVTD